MADFRPIKCNMYEDMEISELSSKELLLYLYLLTNIHTNMCGCYRIPIRNIEFDTRLSKDDVLVGLETLDRCNLVKYSKETGEFLIVNWRFYNWNVSNIIKERINKEIPDIKNELFRKQVAEWKRADENNSVKKTETVYPESNTLFEKIWTLYPKETNKSKVTAAAIKEVCEIGFDRMKLCINNYKKSIEDKEDKYVLGGDTFFNGRYKDYFDNVNVDRSAPMNEELVNARVGQAFNSIIKNFPKETLDGKEKNYLWAAIKDSGKEWDIINAADEIKAYLDEHGTQQISFKEFMKQWLKRKKA